ncbi:conserved domain protein [Streptococcus infantis SK970]|nr:conserved domain protein [Streptococcus infantis SK970]
MEELKLIRISDIQKNPYQPRKEFSKEKLKNLPNLLKKMD